ncbi:MAG: pyruvate:ferredoxin (flavodoxin) oxidoreductase [Coriobacteriales bacterium]|nr:pyruvate:ferredoxin (flavodoxin) oxidoreductase [Coriobacteriales bacterium]
MKRITKTMDGNTAAAYVSYAFTEVAGIYPITPSSPMADYVDQWAAAGKENIFGRPVKVVEMQSEGGAAGTVHGSLATGALTTTYTASQGLLLMIPNMYKIAAEQLPGVFHVSARCVATHALNIFGDHSDVMACRQTGFAMLAESNVQEVMDLGAVAHLSAIKAKIPFLNFFDGFRTSHEIQKIQAWDYRDLKQMCDMKAVQAFRDNALNPNSPTMRGSHENDDTFFQHREACNLHYDKIADVVDGYMQKVNKKLGTNYQLFNYYGAKDADRVIVAMGSICDVAEEVVDYLNAHGQKVGLVKVRLYRPFSIKHFVDVLPKSVKKIAVLDRTKEPGSIGEPLYMDVVSALVEAGRSGITVIGGRYGLGSKDTPPASVFAVYKELKKAKPAREFTIGIDDDLSCLSLPDLENAPITSAKGTIECKFWGLGGDGTVGANKNSIKIIGDHTDKYVQAYFQYDSKKTGGVTVSHLRFGDNPIKSPYYINKADFIACHNPAYITKDFPIVKDLKKGGTLLINCQWNMRELEKNLSASSKKFIYENKIKLYTINAIDLAAQIGMGKRTNTILQSAFFALANILPRDKAIKYMKDAATKSYSKKGADIVAMNHKAIEIGADSLTKIDVPADWGKATGKKTQRALKGDEKLVKMVGEVMQPISLMQGNDLRVSAFKDYATGQFETGAAAYEKRGVAVNVPKWNAEKCIQCNNCSLVCPHAAIRPYLLDAKEAKAAPADMQVADAKGKTKKSYKYTLTISSYDCLGCGVCVNQCPSKCLEMVPFKEGKQAQKAFDWANAKVTDKEEFDTATVKGSQFKKPLLEFSGSCAGCAETAYAKLLTQLFGDRMFISNATGCSSIWGGPAATSPFAKDAEGRGPAWSNSLFEDNAEHGLGMMYGHEAVRLRLVDLTNQLLEMPANGANLQKAAKKWLRTFDDGEANDKAAAEYAQALKPVLKSKSKEKAKLAQAILDDAKMLNKKSYWILGGDGWAYDIGYGGLDHVLASGQDVNVFVFDTEVYSNTGGQSSKASNIGQVAQFAAAGKEVKKKSLSEIAMQYGYVYVAQVAMGANMNQTIKAIKEAESYNGPSLIVAYSPCEMHSIKGGMVNCQTEMKKAVQTGYWNLFRYNPAGEEGKKFSLDSKAPNGKYQEFLLGEARYSSLTRSFPKRAKALFKDAEAEANARFEHLEKLEKFYNE